MNASDPKARLLNGESSRARLVNIRYWADHAIEAMRVQVARLEDGSGHHRVELDFYLITAWRLMEQIR